MKIIVDEQAKVILTQFADVVLKQGGIKNINVVTDVLNSMEDYVDNNKADTKLPTKTIKKIPTGETNG